MTADRFEVRPLSGAIGAEVLGIDLARELDDDAVAAIRRVWLKHLVIFFRDQTLSPEQFLGVARRFGKPVEYPFIKGIDGFPEVTPVVKLEHEKNNFGGIWHSDTSLSRDAADGHDADRARGARLTAATRSSPTSTLPTRPCPRG